jgi:hypothetical protein
MPRTGLWILSIVHLFHVAYNAGQMEYMDENDLEDFWRDYWSMPKEFCQGLTSDVIIVMVMMMMSSVPESQILICRKILICLVCIVARF